jgi:tetratricopeptide (TPR) repeat protein
MIKRSGAVLVACSVGIWLSPLSHAAFHAAAYAQSADLVLCDRLAADPTDQDKPADVAGTAEIAASDIATAIKFCRIAGSGSRRALYQLGRAYAANRQLPEAIAAYRKAADKGSTSAMVELGVLLATGSGVAEDRVQARKLFERAAEAGNPRGVTNLAALSEIRRRPRGSRQDAARTCSMLCSVILRMSAGISNGGALVIMPSMTPRSATCSFELLLGAYTITTLPQGRCRSVRSGRTRNQAAVSTNTCIQKSLPC